MSKWMYVLGVILIAGFAVLGLLEMQKAATPYVTSVAEAKSAGDRQIQFLGMIVHDKTSYKESDNQFAFQLKDENGETINVRSKDIKPGNFDSADRAIVRGIYSGKEFVADQVQCSCPSKYKEK